MNEIISPKNIDNETADAVVIGGGIVGASTAFWLSKAGMKVILVEKTRWTFNFDHSRKC